MSTVIENKLAHISGRIAGAAFAAKTISKDEVMAKLLIEISGDLSKVIDEIKKEEG